MALLEGLDRSILAGSGNSTLSSAITAAHPSFERNSIDETIHATLGMYAVDYPAEKYQEYQDAAGKECDERLLELLKEKSKDVLLDQSFYSKEDRSKVKQLVENEGARWVLVYLRASEED